MNMLQYRLFRHVVNLELNPPFAPKFMWVLLSHLWWLFLGILSGGLGLRHK